LGLLPQRCTAMGRHALGNLLRLPRRTETTISVPEGINKRVDPFLLKLPPTKISTLKNGITVATEENPGETAAIGVYIRTGSVYETEKNNGVAHFIEHMAFKGTSKRTQQSIELEMENNGATLNAYTSREHTSFQARAPKDKLPVCLDVLADILQNSTFAAESVERERETILREMEEVQNDEEETMFDYLHAAAYQGHSLGRTILGPIENIKKFTREDLLEYIKTYYTGPRIVVAAAGAINHEQIVTQTEKLFSSISNVDNFSQPAPVVYTGSEVLIRNDELPVVHLAVGVEGISIVDPDIFVAMLVQTIVGTWDRSYGGGSNLSSRLCEAVAHGQYAHHFQTFNTAYEQTGLFGIQAVVPEDKLQPFLELAMDEYVRIGQRLHVSELEFAKKKLKAALLMALDGNTAVIEDIGRQLVSIGRRMTPAEIFLRIDDINLADLTKFIDAIYYDSSPVVYAKGPIKDYPGYNVIKGYTYWTSR